MADYTLLLAELVEAVQKITSAAPDMTAPEILAVLAGNAGAESGLDADLLDGLQASQFVRNDGSINGTQSINGHIALTGDLSAQEVTVNSIFRVKDSGGAVRVLYSAVDDALVFYEYNNEVARINTLDGKITAGAISVAGSSSSTEHELATHRNLATSGWGGKMELPVLDVINGTAWVTLATITMPSTAGYPCIIDIALTTSGSAYGAHEFRELYFAKTTSSGILLSLMRSDATHVSVQVVASGDSILVQGKSASAGSNRLSGVISVIGASKSTTLS